MGYKILGPVTGGGAEARCHIPRIDNPGPSEFEVWGSCMLRAELLRPGKGSAWDLKS